MSVFYKFFSIIGLLACGLSGCKKPDLTLSSPDGRIQLTFEIIEKAPCYSVIKDGKPIVEPSRLGFEFKNMPALSSGFEVTGVERNSVDTVWEQPWGEFRFIQDHHNELTVKLKEKRGEKRLLNIIFRVFNDGVGFRYQFPKQENLDSLVIINELTEFLFPDEHHVWWIPVHSENSYYESLYRYTSVRETDTINTPATFETHEGHYLVIHEANLTDYASMTLRKVSGKGFVSELVPWSNGVKVYGKAPFETPWRTLTIAENAGDLVTSTIMLNLNDPCALEDVSWIEPSKYIGIWWGMHMEKYTWGQGPRHGATTVNTKDYIDFAAENGFNGVLVEGWNFGWDGDWSSNGNDFSFTKPYPDFNLEEIALYAASKNVRLIGHHETGGAALNYQNQMEEAYKLYRKNGINAVKTGYVNKYLDGKEWHDGQYGVRHYRKVIETAAQYNIMINNHEPVKGTGIQRTYPNLMTQEGGRGQEYDAWSVDGGNPPSHTTILPFTRLLSGPFDFTPGTFNFENGVNPGTRVQTTLAKQLALYVVLFSPQQMASDLPENYKENAAFQFVKDVPSIWSETKVINAEIGKYVTMARKDWEGEEWFLGCVTNEEPRSFDLKLSFLDENVNYKAQIYTDGKDADWQTNPYSVEIVTQMVNRDSEINVKLKPGGGTAIRLIPN